MRSLVQIYALAVCFFTLMCFVVALGIGSYDAVQLAVPNVTLQFYQPYQSNDAFLQYYPDKKDMPTEKIEQLRAQGLRDALDAERRAAFQSAIFVLIIVAIDIIVFAIHWGIARKEQHKAGQIAAGSS